MFLLLYIKMIFLSYLKNLASLSDYDCHLASRPNQPVDQAAHRGERRLGRFCRPSAGRHLFCLGKNAAPRPRCCCGPRLSTARGQARPASCLTRALRGCPAENGLEVRKPGSLGKKDEILFFFFFLKKKKKPQYQKKRKGGNLIFNSLKC